MPYRVVGQPVLLAPGGGVAVQARHPVGLLLLQAGAEQVGEQVVVAPPAAHLIQRHEEQAGPLHLLQQCLAPGAAGDRVAQVAAEALQHGGLQQEGAHLAALLLEYLLGQEVQDEAVAAGKRRHEPLGIELAAQRQRGQLQPGGPALGPPRQRRHRRIGQGPAGPGRRLPQQRGRLGGGEPQLGGAQLGQLPAGAQPGQRQRRVTAAGQYHP